MDGWQITSRNPIPIEEMEVLGYHPNQIDLDFNLKGIRVGFMMDDGTFTSARWNNEQDNQFADTSLIPTKWHKITINP